jgi:hypothetical protein
MARVSISLPDEVFEKIKATKPEHKALSNHVSELCIEAMKARELTPTMTGEIAELKEMVQLMAKKLFN